MWQPSVSATFRRVRSWIFVSPWRLRPTAQARWASLVVLDWVGAASDVPTSTRAVIDVTPATDQQVADAPADRAVIAEIVKIASASARDDALRSNSRGDFDGALSSINKAIDLVTVLERDYPEAAAEAAVLRESLGSYSVSMPAMEAKRQKMASYEQRRSRAR